MTWDPFGTLAKTLWIGGGQWAGKSTVAMLIAERFGMTAYRYDFPSARAHWDRRVAAAAVAGAPLPVTSAQHMFVDMEPEESAESALGVLHETFEWALDDLRGLVSGRPIVAEGWGLRPELVAPILPGVDQMIVMVPTDEFRRSQAANLDRAKQPHGPVTDLAVAQRNRLERDRLVALDAVTNARRLGIRVLEIDGSIPVEGVFDIVAAHFAAHLPTR